MMNLSIDAPQVWCFRISFKGEPRQKSSMRLLRWCIRVGAHDQPQYRLSKVFQIFSQMAKSNFSIAVDEDNVNDLSTTEWRIIQEVGYGSQTRKLLPNFSYQKEPCAITYQRF